MPECESAWAAQYDEPLMTSLLPEEPCRRYAPLNITAGANVGAIAGANEGATCTRDMFHADELLTCDDFVYESPTETIFAEVCMRLKYYLPSIRKVEKIYQ